MYYINAGRLKQ